MKNQYTSPKDWQFFQSYAGLLPTLSYLGYIAQLISALTEFGVIYALVHQSMADTFPQYALPASLFGAVLGTAFLEVGLRRFLPYSFRAFYFRRFSGLHLAISLPLLFMTLALVFASGYLSVQGSLEIVRQSAPGAPIGSDTLALQRAARQEAATLGLWATDSTLLERRFDPPLNNALLKHQSAVQRETNLWRNRGMALPRARRAELEAGYSTERAVILQQKADAFQKAQDARDMRLEKIEAEKAAALAQLNRQNQASALRADQKIALYGNGLAKFTILALGILILSIGIEEAHRKGSGIEEIVTLRTSDIKNGLLDEFAQATRKRTEQLMLAWIHRIYPPGPTSTGERPLAALPKLYPRDVPESSSSSPLFTILDEPYSHSCQQCATPFTPNTTWQKFCSKDCRMAFHEGKHGKKYLPTKVYRAQQRAEERKQKVMGLFELG